ncbi:MAG: LysR substrate-binding domain-containing protein [Bacillota bacterium]
MRIEQLFYLVEVAKSKSITLASENNYVTQPSISHAIKVLEKELDITIFERTNKGVALTEIGSKVVQKAEEILKNIEELKLEVEIYKSDMKQELSGDLTVSAQPIVCNILLPEVISAFHKEHPNVNIKIHETGYYDLVKNIKFGKSDIGLIIGVNEHFKQLKSDNKIYYEELMVDKFFAYAKNTLSISNMEEISFDELLKWPLILCGQEQYGGRGLLDLMGKYGNPKKILSTNSVAIFQKAVLDGVGVGIIGKLFAKNLKECKTSMLIPLNDNINIFIGWIKLSNTKVSKIEQEFINTLKSTVANDFRHSL